MYEANPLSMIVENAGGKSSNGKKRILEIIPEKLHQRTPLFIGSYDDVTECEMYVSNDGIE